MEKLNLSYLSVNSDKSYAFYMIPKELFENGLFDGVDINSKVLYGFMLDRASLSATNSDFIDDNGNVYIIYTVEQVMDSMNCSRPTAIKMLKQLDDIGLIEKRRQGQGKPSLIYVKDFSTANTELSTENKENNFRKKRNNFRKLEILTAENEKNKLKEVKKHDCNHTNQIHTDPSDTNPIGRAEKIDFSPPDFYDFDLYDSAQKIDDSDSNVSAPSNVAAPANQHLDIENLILKYPEKESTLLEIQKIISETFKGAQRTFRVGKQDLDAYKVRYALRSLNNRHIEYLINSLKKDKTNIKSYKNYLLTALYNASNKNFLDLEAIKATVSHNINLKALCNMYPDNRKEIQEIYAIIVETLVIQKKSFRIAKGELPSELVKESFAALTVEHIAYVLDSLRRNTSEIKSAKAFLQTCLWNSTKTLNNQLYLDVRRDLYEHLGIQPK